MFARFFLAALLAGILAGVFVTPVQHLKTTPLIVAAETYEAGANRTTTPRLRPASSRRPMPMGGRERRRAAWLLASAARFSPMS